LEVLYRLIQWKGKPLSFEKDSAYNGLKVIEFGEKDYIGFIRQGVSPSFFPCKLQIVILRKLCNVRESNVKYK